MVMVRVRMPRRIVNLRGRSCPSSRIQPVPQGAVTSYGRLTPKDNRFLIGSSIPAHVTLVGYGLVLVPMLPTWRVTGPQALPGVADGKPIVEMEKAEVTIVTDGVAVASH
jgi:hypothetical protein